MPLSGRSRRGVALVLAAGFLAVMSAIAVAAVLAARGARNDASQERRRMEAAAALDAVTADAMVAIVAGGAGFEPGPDRMASANGLTVRVKIAREDRKIDLNTAGESVLMAAFMAAGAGAPLAARMAGATADWRDRDALRRLNGAEAADYARAGQTGPANQPFFAEAEWLSVLGVGQTVADCMGAKITVLAQDGAFAPPPGQRPSPPGSVFAIEAEIVAAAQSVGGGLRTVVRTSGDATRPIHIVAREPLSAPPACRDGGARP
jgi:type II secretory pathway component PulK